MNVDRPRALGIACALATLVACRPPAPAAPAPAPVAAPAPAPAAVPAPEPAPVVSQPTAAPCGNLGCLAFPSPEAAFDHVLATNPKLLGIGEAHAQKGSEGIPSTARRFSDLFLPRLRGKASDLVLELLVANGSCGKSEQKVAEKQREVTKPQAETNQNEYVSLGSSAKAQGIRPHALTPTCAEYNAIAGAGGNDIELMLTTVADAARRSLLGLLERQPEANAASLIVAYGGALHNDLAPRAGRERWSFGPALRERLGPAYVELDLIVREYVKDTESWRAFPWYAELAGRPAGRETLLYSPNPGSFVLIFPSSTR